MSASCIMSDLGPSWDASTIKLLLGLSLDDDDDETLKIEFMNNVRKDDDSSSSNTKSAKLTFANRSMMHRIIHAYDGLVIPMTHGYHYTISLKLLMVIVMVTTVLHIHKRLHYIFNSWPYRHQLWSAVSKD